MTETQDEIAALATKHKGLRETVCKIELELAKGVADLQKGGHREIHLKLPEIERAITRTNEEIGRLHGLKGHFPTREIPTFKQEASSGETGGFVNGKAFCPRPNASDQTLSTSRGPPATGANPGRRVE